MANTKSAEKAARRAETNRNRNVALRSRMRSALRKVVDAVAAGNKTDASAALKDAQPVIDSLVNKNVIHRNKAARHKSALSARIKAMPARSTAEQDFAAPLLQESGRGARDSRLTPAFSFLRAGFLARRRLGGLAASHALASAS